MDVNTPHLSRLLAGAAARRPDHTAVEDEHGRTLSYADLSRAADRLATRLARWGVGRGDRVGLFLPKTIEAVAAIHGVLRSGAAYVPVDPTAPARAGRASSPTAVSRRSSSPSPSPPASRRPGPAPAPCRG